VVEKRLLAVFTATCALGLAVVLTLFQLHVHGVIPCLCSLPTEPFNWRTLCLCRGVDILKFDRKSTELSCFILAERGALFGGAKPTESPRGYGITRFPPDVYFENCITKPCQVGHTPFGCSAVITTSYVRR